MIWKVFSGAFEIVADKNYSQRSCLCNGGKQLFATRNLISPTFYKLNSWNAMWRIVSILNGFSMQRFLKVPIESWIITLVNIKNKQTHRPRVIHVFNITFCSHISVLLYDVSFFASEEGIRFPEAQILFKHQARTNEASFLWGILCEHFLNNCHHRFDNWNSAPASVGR